MGNITRNAHTMCVQQWFESTLASSDIPYKRAGLNRAQARGFGSDAETAPDGG